MKEKKWKKVYINRLDKLLKAAEDGKLGHKFDFSTFKSKCGTLGCLLGGCPTVFPKEWVYDFSNQWPTYGFNCLPITSAMNFFGLSKGEVDHLFFPGRQNPKWGKYLYLNVSLRSVVANARKLIELKKSGKLYQNEVK